MPTFDPTKPVDHSPVTALELRNQLNALAEQLAGVSQFCNDSTASNINALNTLDTPFTTPPTTADLETLRNKLNDLINAL